MRLDRSLVVDFTVCSCGLLMCRKLTVQFTEHGQEDVAGVGAHEEAVLNLRCGFELRKHLIHFEARKKE